jgi:hypothetical protein
MGVEQYYVDQKTGFRRKETHTSTRNRFMKVTKNDWGNLVPRINFENALAGSSKYVKLRYYM